MRSKDIDGYGEAVGRLHTLVANALLKTNRWIETRNTSRAMDMTKANKKRR